MENLLEVVHNTYNDITVKADTMVSLTQRATHIFLVGMALCNQAVDYNIAMPLQGRQTKS